MKKEKEEGKVSFWKRMKILVLLSAVFALSLSIHAAAAGKNLSTATPISVGSTVEGILSGSYSNDTDYYKFSLSRNSVIHLSAKTGGHYQNIYVQVLWSSGPGIAGSPYDFSTSDSYNWGYQSGGRYMALNKGTYFIKVSNFYGQNASYSMTISETERQEGNTKIAGPNNGYLKNAVPIVIGNRLFGVAYGYERYYKFTLSQAQTITFRSRITSDLGTVHLWLYYGSGSLLRTIRSITYGQTYTDTIRLEAGTYFIGVEKYSGSVRYEVKTSTVKKSQKITAKVSSKTYKKAVINKKSQSFSIGAKAKTKLTYSSSNSRYVTVNSKGKVTVKKGARKGIYTITVKAAASSSYSSASKKIRVTVK